MYLLLSFFSRTSSGFKAWPICPTLLNSECRHAHNFCIAMAAKICRMPLSSLCQCHTSNSLNRSLHPSSACRSSTTLPQNKSWSCQRYHRCSIKASTDNWRKKAANERPKCNYIYCKIRFRKWVPHKRPKTKPHTHKTKRLFHFARHTFLQTWVIDRFSPHI